MPLETGARGDRTSIVERLKLFFNVEVDAVTFRKLFPNPNGLDYFCEQNNLVYHPNPTTGGYTFWDKTKLAEAEEEAKEDEVNIKRLREMNEESIIEPPF